MCVRPAWDFCHACICVLFLCFAFASLSSHIRLPSASSSLPTSPIKSPASSPSKTPTPSPNYSSIKKTCLQLGIKPERALENGRLGSLQEALATPTLIDLSFSNHRKTVSPPKLNRLKTASLPRLRSSTSSSSLKLQTTSEIDYGLAITPCTAISETQTDKSKLEGVDSLPLRPRSR
eukprot:m.173191 g.173191  ORF g.173191 m.173191 type:complete len:177 (+) comp25243_c0_seq1:1196-1726(+)